MHHTFARITACDHESYLSLQWPGGCTFRGVTNVTVDGCDITTGALAFHQGPDDVFKKITLTKCNLFTGSTLVLDRAENPDAKSEKVKLDKFYFGPKSGGPAVTKKEKIAALIEDGTDKPERNVVALFGKPLKRKHSLVGYGQLRMRVPELR